MSNPNEPCHSRRSELLNETKGATRNKRYWSRHIEGGGHEADFSLNFLKISIYFDNVGANVVDISQCSQPVASEGSETLLGRLCPKE